ncbi:MAG: diacylglycerol kinase family lipid kinase [Ignavibacteriales bacterium]|nr:MAG: diacylglycerol kinase family lipid kinase [Ignavibacteriales bacterium]
MKKIIIINPIAGRGRCEKIIPKIKETIKKQVHDFDILLTERKNHAKEFVASLKDELKVIYSVGGDGTINEIVNGIKNFENTILGILPFGSGNDFAKSLGIKHDLTTLDKVPETKKIDIGKVSYKISSSEALNETFFVNSLGIGFDALIAHLIAKNKTLKGLPLYLSAVFKGITKFNSFEAEAKFDDDIYRGKRLLIAIGNGKTSGGGFKLNPFAELFDGKLDACLVEDLSHLNILRKLPKAILGTHANLKEVSIKTFKDSVIELKQSTWMHSDGEVVSDSVNYVKTSILNKQLEVIIN